MLLFPYNEAKYYSFALKAGLKNLRLNGFRLGLKKTLGKLTQPINSYTRFPEYHFFEASIRDHLRDPTIGKRVLDIGSPKMFGFLMASSIPATFILTDLSAADVSEYECLWKAVEDGAQGHAQFAVQDARALRFENAELDIVFSMSVIEHVEGDFGDSDAVREMLRVLKPGGLFLLSVPFGPKYQEQVRVGLSGASRRTGDNTAYFFQRIYDKKSFEKRILSHADIEAPRFETVWRSHPWAHRLFGAIGENARGALGFVNPLLSSFINKSCEGIIPVRGYYGRTYTGRDVYGDLLFSGIKK